MKNKITLHFLLLISILSSAPLPVYCQVRNYKCVNKCTFLNGRNLIDSTIYSVAIDVKNKIIEINEPLSIHFKILRQKVEYTNSSKKVTVYKVRQKNGKRGKRGEIAVISNITDENADSPLLYYSPTSLTIGRINAIERKYPPRMWSLVSM